MQEIDVIIRNDFDRRHFLVPIEHLDIPVDLRPWYVGSAAFFQAPGD
jgi:hypothetical protein